MTTETIAPPTTTRTPDSAGRIRGLRCRNCGQDEPLGPAYVCPACFGPLEVTYDYPVIRAQIDRQTIASRAPGIWRYLELLPVDAPPPRGLPVGSSPLLRGPRIGRELGVDSLWLKDDTRNPTLSFKDRVVAVAAARALTFGFETLACASTGNLAGATAAAAAAVGLRAFVFVPADLEPAKIGHALAYGATVVRVDGTYDELNRLCLEVADEEGWGFVNVNLRPFYAEGSKTLGLEIAEQLGWRLPDVVVVPVASGALLTKVAKAFEELADVGLIEPRPVRFIGAQAAGCSPVATAFARGSSEIIPIQHPDTIVKSLAIGSPADGRYALDLAHRSGGSVEAVEDAATAGWIRRLAATEGIFAETAGGVTLGAVDAARRRGIIEQDDEVVALLTGNGLKTPDARLYGLTAAGSSAAETGLTPPIRPSLQAFEDWLSAGAWAREPVGAAS